MKKLYKSLILLPLLPFLASCDESYWSWWEDDNIDIEKYISLSDAQEAIDKSAKNYTLPTIKKNKIVYHTYYKEYLGKFATETDNDIDYSYSETNSKYQNDTIVTNSSLSNEVHFLNAKKIIRENKDIYYLANEDKSILKRTIIDYGYGNKIGSDTLLPNDELTYDSTMYLGSKMDSSSISWGDRVTYGFSKNNDVIVETMSSSSSTYTVKFNGRLLSTYVTNNYTLYRFKEIKKEDGVSDYMLDYVYNKIEVYIGSNIFDEPLKEPFLLEKRESSLTYSIKENGDYDKTTIPNISLS